MLQSNDEFSCRTNNSEDIFKKNMLDRYHDRLNESFLSGSYGCKNLICYAEFLHYYYLAAKLQDNDWQPVELSDDLVENNFLNKIYPPIIPLMTCNYKLECRKVTFVSLLFTPNKGKDYELYAHHLLMLYYLFQKESDLKSGSAPSYTNKLSKVDILQIVNENGQKVKPYANLVDEALIRHNTEVFIVDRGFLTSLFYEDSHILPTPPSSNFVHHPHPLSCCL